MRLPQVRPTILDVAAEANVAVGTVSRVLNTPEAVSPDIRQRVLDTIERMNYRPLRRRRKPASRDGSTPRRRGNLGVIFMGMDDSLTHLPVNTDALHGVELGAAGENLNLMLSNLPQADRVPVFLTRNQVDGLLIKSPLLGNLAECASPVLIEAIERLPHVWLIGRPNGATGDMVGIDNEEGGRIAARYLYDHGHRRVGFVHPRPGQTRSESLKHFFKHAAGALGVEVTFLEPDRLKNVRWPLPAISDPSAVLPLLDRWQAEPESSRATAIVVPADSIAVQIYAALQQKGLQVGRDLSLLSFNNEKPLVMGLSPPLTTIDIRAEAIGRRAVDQLSWRLAHPGDEIAVKILLRPRLVEGGSVARIS